MIGRMPGETSCVSLVWAVLDRASPGWRGVGHTAATLRHLAELRHQLFHPTATEEVNAQATTHAA